ncbi:unnamed protein product [Urochloa decumbens]|uniref:F-box domain-containing protein n=1 Tax=Urochloa decumbens TaxID=240449 RepID=A0ABC9CM86_9POAL
MVPPPPLAARSFKGGDDGEAVSFSGDRKRAFLPQVLIGLNGRAIRTGGAPICPPLPFFPIPAEIKTTRRRWFERRNRIVRYLLLLLLSLMASPLHSSESEDRLSMLPDDILLQIMYHLNLRTQILSSTGLSTRWRHLPSMLTDLIINVDEFLPRTETLTTDQLKKSMDVYAETTRRLLASTSQHAIKILCLSFYLTDPHLQAIGSAVGSIVEHGDTKLLEFNMMADWHDLDYRLEASVQFGQRFMAFFGSCPSAFRWLTSLSIENLRFNESDMSSLLDVCDQLRFLSMRSCDCGPQSVLKIDTPRSQLMELVFDMFIRVELIQVPKLMHVVCDILVFESPAIVFGHVPLLHGISLSSMIMNQPPLMLSNWLSNVRSLSTLTLDFKNWVIWIKPEGPKRLSLIFSKLRDLHLCGIFFSEYNLEWTFYLLEAAPSLKNFFLKHLY